ncbi:hypothetical protein ACFLT5_03590 [Chloroflexota bacterium]
MRLSVNGPGDRGGMALEALHARYVPILHFASGERFYPMAVHDFLAYCTLRQKGSGNPLVRQGHITPSLIARAYSGSVDVYLQSVAGELADQNVVARWSKDLWRSTLDVSHRVRHWREELAREAYQWFSPKTKTATELFWWNDLIMPLMSVGRRSKTDLPRLSLPPEIRQAAVENYEGSQHPQPNYTYYYRTTRDSEYLCLQYWFFYAFNDWATAFGGMNDHEGDWEGVHLFFSLDSKGWPQEPPAYVTFAGHHSRLTKPWKHHDVILDGTHPVAYVAAGSHATYPERKRYDLIKVYDLVDHATGGGRTIQPSDWRQRIPLSGEPWSTGFLGAWGTRYWLPATWQSQILGTLQAGIDEFGLPGVSAPRGYGRRH